MISISVRAASAARRGSLSRRVLALFAAVLAAAFTLLAPPPPRASAQAGMAINKYIVASPPANPSSITTNFTNVTTAVTTVPYTYVITITAPNGSPVTITDTLPSGFNATGCTAYVDTVLVNPAPANCPGSGSTWTIGPLTPTGNPGSIVVYIEGTFTQSGAFTNTVKATAPSLAPVSASVNVQVTPPSPVFDLEVHKTASSAMFINGTPVTYTLTVHNPTANAIAALTSGANPIVSLFDRLTNVGGAFVDANWTFGGCSATTGSQCFNPPTPATGTAYLAPGSNADLFGTSGISASSGAVILPGGTLTITLTVNYFAYGCAGIKIDNKTYLSAGGLGANFADANPANNAETVQVQLASSSPCLPPSIGVAKAVTATAGWNGVTSYKVELTNNYTVPVDIQYDDRVWTPALAATTFDVSTSNDVCAGVACGPAHTITNHTFVGSAKKAIIDRSVPLKPVLTIPAGGSWTLTYDSVYKATCQIRPVEIDNVFTARGLTQEPTPIGFTIEQTASVVMPALPRCKWKVTKTQVPSASSPPIVFGAPFSATYIVRWQNIGSSTLRLGTVWDSMSISDPLYAAVPVTAQFVSPPNDCVQAGGANWTRTLATSLTAQPAAPEANGAKVVLGSNAVFPPGPSWITCKIKVIASRPSPTDPRCMSNPTAWLINQALGDIDPAFDPNQPTASLFPFQHAEVRRRLPRCRNLTLHKEPAAGYQVVLPGDPMVWTITATNNGPTPNGAIAGFSLSDVLPPGTSFISASSSCATRSGLTFTFNSPLAAGASCTITLTTTSPSTANTPFTNTVNRGAAGPGFYFHDDVSVQATAQGYTAYPIITKAFAPNPLGVGQNGTLTFTVTNLSYKPAVTGMSFTDQLPAGLTYGTPITTTCAGPVPTMAGGALVANNLSMTAGTPSCTVTIPFNAHNCGTYDNLASDVTAVSHVKPDLGATLVVNGCNTGGGNNNTGGGGGGTPTLTKSFASGAGFGSQVTFTITNPTGSTTTSGLGFTDTLPVPTGGNPPAVQLSSSNVVSNSCGGTVTTGNTITLTGGAVASGSSCTIVVQLSFNACGTYTNAASNVVGAGGLDTSQVSAVLTIPCSTGGGNQAIKITKDVNGAAVAGTFVFLVNCGTYSTTVTLTLPSLFQWTSPALPAGTTTCQVTESSITSSVASWDPATFTLQTSGASMTGTGNSRTITMAASGVTHLSVVNNATATTTTTPTGGNQTITIEKLVWGLGTTQSVNSTWTGTFSFGVVCGSATYTASVTYPSPGIWTSPTLPANTASCTVTENTPLPTGVPWAGTPVGQPRFFKGAPTTPNEIAGTGYGRTVTLNASGNTLVTIANQRI